MITASMPDTGLRGVMVERKREEERERERERREGERGKQRHQTFSYLHGNLVWCLSSAHLTVLI